MIILNEITISAVAVLKTRTHLSTAGNITTFSRLIDSKMHSCEINDATMRGLTNICRLDDKMFKMICSE